MQALAVGGFDAALLAYVTAALTLVTLILGAAVVVSVGQESTITRIGAATPSIKRWGGWVLLFLGTWFILLSVFSRTFEDLFF